MFLCDIRCVECNVSTLHSTAPAFRPATAMPHAPVSAAPVVWMCQKRSHLTACGEIIGRPDAYYVAEIKCTSIFWSKNCHIFAKTPKNEGKSVDVVENNRTKLVTLGPSVDVVENKGR